MSEVQTIAQLAEKYGKKGTTRKQASQARFDASAFQGDKEVLKRISQEPELKGIGDTDTGKLHAELAEIQLDLAELAEEYGKLNVNFGNVIGQKSIYTFGEAFRIKWNELVGDKKEARELKIAAAGRRGDSIELMVNKISEVLQDQYQKAVQGKARAEEMQVENIAHMKTLDRKLIDSLTSGYSGGSDYAAAQEEVKKLEADLKEIEEYITEREKDVQAAKAEGDLEKVNVITDDLSQALEIKYGVLDGKLSSDGVVSDIRRDMLDSAEAVQSSKGAIAASKVNYKAISALIDAMNELEVKYRHALEDMVPVFKIQGKIAGLGQQAMDIQKTLVQVAEVSQRLMETNGKLVTRLATETFKLLKTPIYDLEKAGQIEAEITQYMDQLNQLKVEWAENQQTIGNLSTNAVHYAVDQ